MYGIFSLVLAACILSVYSASLDEKISNYFKSDVFKAFQKHWQAHRKSFENAILLALKENYGYKGMNVYVRRSTDSLRVSNGFYVNDNVVDVLLLDMTLTSLPHLTMPEVTFALASNILRLEAGLSKMIVETRYLLFRNQSDILYTPAQDPYKSSPFTYQQVENVGQLAIVADDCMLDGYTLAKLSGQSVNLGHDTFQVRDCKFSIEISPYRHGWPPVIAPYFSKNQGKQLEMLLTKPIREELMPKLQAAVFTYINASLIFGEHLSKFREYQDNIFKEVSKNVTDLVRNINNITINVQEETVDLKPVEVSRNISCHVGSCWDYILIHNVTLHGLDTLYSSHAGGPFKLQSPLVAEALRFNSIMIRGSLLYENKTFKAEHYFVTEINDMIVNIEIDLKKSEPTFTVLNWRKMELSVIELEHNLRDRRAASAFVSGYLINKLPDVLEEHLSSIYLQYKNSTIKVQKLRNVNVNCNNVGGGYGYGVVMQPYPYWFGCCGMSRNHIAPYKKKVPRPYQRKKKRASTSSSSDSSDSESYRSYKKRKRPRQRCVKKRCHRRRRSYSSRT